MRSITLFLRDFNGVAYTQGSELDDDHKEIHLSTTYVNKISTDRIRDEIIGVITHEVVHCFQYNGKGTCPGGLIEGIAGNNTNDISTDISINKHDLVTFSRQKIKQN